jgi:hypothetical protein
MPRPLRDAKQPVILLRDVEVDPDNHNIRYGTGRCPRCGFVSRFKQDRFPMNYFKMESQVWLCSVCEWSSPGVPDDSGESVIEYYRDPDL